MRMLCAWRVMVRKGGFEPPRLSAPPPQDGVSASSTTSALCKLSAINRLAGSAHEGACERIRIAYRVADIDVIVSRDILQCEGISGLDLEPSENDKREEIRYRRGDLSRSASLTLMQSFSAMRRFRCFPSNIRCGLRRAVACARRLLAPVSSGRCPSRANSKSDSRLCIGSGCLAQSSSRL